MRPVWYPTHRGGGQTDPFPFRWKVVASHLCRNLMLTLHFDSWQYLQLPGLVLLTGARGLACVL